MVAFITLLTTSACGDTQNEEGEKGYESKTYEHEITISAYEADTVLTVQEFVRAIESIRTDANWLTTEIFDSAADSLKLKVTCLRNTTTATRSGKILVTSKNKDQLTLKVNQKYLDGFEDLHNNVSDQPALAPGR